MNRWILLFYPWLVCCYHLPGKTNEPVKSFSGITRQLKWSDEFNGPNGPIDSNKWVHQLGGDGWGNNEDQFYTPRTENSRIQNGYLVIEARKEDFANRKYTSARIYSKAKWKYGRIEVRARLPEGRGSWPAIWMLPESLYNKSMGWPDCGEIDIMEHVGFDPGVIVSSLHSKTYNWMNHNQKTNKTTIQEPSTQFHVYTLDWSAERMEFYVDDHLIYRIEKEPGADVKQWPFDQDFHLILNNAIGGFWGGEKGIDDASFPQTFLIDYVRVYQD